MNQITPQELISWQEMEKDHLLLDVRQDWERAAYHIGGLHIPMEEVLQRRGELPQDRPVVVYCEKGIRSAVIIQRLEAAGYEKLYNLGGGMKAWKELKGD